MKSRKFVFLQTGIIALGQALCAAAMIGIFALLGKYQASVLWGSIAGAVLATVNFLVMSLVADMAADKAEQQDVAGGQKMIQLSYMGRMVGLLVVLVVCAKSGIFHPLALVLPLAFTRPILTVSELFKKKGGN